MSSKTSSGAELLQSPFVKFLAKLVKSFRAFFKGLFRLGLEFNCGGCDRGAVGSGWGCGSAVEAAVVVTAAFFRFFLGGLLSFPPCCLTLRTVFWDVGLCLG